MERYEVVGIFHAKRVILMSSVYSLAIGMPSPKLQTEKAYK